MQQSTEAPPVSSVTSESSAQPAPADWVIPGFAWAPGERPIVVGKPGHELTLSIVLFGISVILAPLAYWLWRRAGKLYVVTNQRSLRVNRSGDVVEIPHDQLSAVETQRSIWHAQWNTLKLVPKQGSSHQPVLFAYCGGFTPHTAFARLWAALEFWVIQRKGDVNQAPTVDMTGTISERVELHGVVAAGLVDGDLTGTAYGAAILTSEALHWYMEGSESNRVLKRGIPAYAFALAVLRGSTPVRATHDLTHAFAGTLAEGDARVVSWNDVTDVKWSGGVLMFKHRTEGKRSVYNFKSKDRDAVKSVLQERGLL